MDTPTQGPVMAPGVERLAATMIGKLGPWFLAAAADTIANFRAISSPPTGIDDLLDRSSRMRPCTEH